MVTEQQNIMCQDSGKSPASTFCYQPAVAEIRVKTSEDSVGKDMLVCQKHFMHPSYPVIQIISTSVTIPPPITKRRDIVNKYPIGDTWFMVMTIRGARGLPPGEWPMHLVSRKVDTRICVIYEIYSIKGEESA